MIGIMEMTERVERGLTECDACSCYFPARDKNGESNVITSDILTKSSFCSTKCRDEAEQAAEDARR